MAPFFFAVLTEAEFVHCVKEGWAVVYGVLLRHLLGVVINVMPFVAP